MYIAMFKLLSNVSLGFTEHGASCLQTLYHSAQFLNTWENLSSFLKLSCCLGVQLKLAA